MPSPEIAFRQVKPALGQRIGRGSPARSQMRLQVPRPRRRVAVPRGRDVVPCDRDAPLSERFDLVVIGAGPAGEKAGAQAAYFGRRVAIVDRRADPGGSAASKTGGAPTTRREAALYLTGFRRRALYG